MTNQDGKKVKISKEKVGIAIGILLVLIGVAWSSHDLPYPQAWTAPGFSIMFIAILMWNRKTSAPQKKRHS